MKVKDAGIDMHLQHVLFQDEMLAPVLRDVLLDCTSRRAIVIEAGHAAIYLE